MKTHFTILLLTLATGISFSQSSPTKIYCKEVSKATDVLEEVKYQNAIETLLGEKIEACSIEKSNSNLVASNINPFIFAVHTAYGEHRPLSISPDMIWLLICQGFAQHIDYNTEELRNKFVHFSDKKTITIATESLSMDFHKGNPNSPWQLAFPAFTDSIEQYIGPDLRNLFVSKFSTTTSTDKSAFEITLMDAMSGYFKYEMTTSCGIPEITLEGNLQDWTMIREKLITLRGYNIDNWINAMVPLIDEFINAKNGKINYDFWNSIYKVNGGSGGPYIQGWIIKFFPYLNTAKDKKRFNPYIDKDPTGSFDGLKTSDFYIGISKAEFTWYYYNSKFDMEFVAGFIGVKQDNKTLTLRPEIGWAVKDKKIEEK